MQEGTKRQEHERVILSSRLDGTQEKGGTPWVHSGSGGVGTLQNVLANFIKKVGILVWQPLEVSSPRAS